MTFRIVLALSLAGCVAGDMAPDPGTQNPGSGSDSGSGSGGNGSGSGSGSGSQDDGAPAMVSDAPSVSAQSACGGLSPITFGDAVTTNGCNIAANTTGRCSPSSNTTLDGLFAGCVIQANQSDCQLPSPYVECPLGKTTGPISASYFPPLGQAGYAFEVDYTRNFSGGSAQIQYSAYEMGVRTDGSIAWTGPATTGQAQMSTGDCCQLQYLVYFPGSGMGEKVVIDLQHF